MVALTLAMLSALANFFFIPYYPFWSLIMIALDCWVIWALTRPGVVHPLRFFTDGSFRATEGDRESFPFRGGFFFAGPLDRHPRRGSKFPPVRSVGPRVRGSGVLRDGPRTEFPRSQRKPRL